MTLQLLTDFFETDIMNHCEVLKYIMQDLGKSDQPLLIACLDALANDGKKERESIDPFYNGHESMPKNARNLVKTYGCLDSMKGHEFNIYEVTFLDREKWKYWAQAILTFIFQFTIFIILVIYNLQDAEISDDPMVISVTILTTMFFGKLCWAQHASAYTFVTVFSQIGFGNQWTDPLLIMNTITNSVLSFVVPFFNIYFMLLSENPNDAVMNALALYFVLELDDIIKPNWDENRIFDELAINAHDFIMEESNNELRVTKDKHIDINDEDKVYVQILRREKIVRLHVRRTKIKYEQVNYTIEGDEADDFIKDLYNFHCLWNYRDIHD